jgi:hypothetical protein
MRQDLRLRIKRILIAFGIVWMVAVTWLLFVTLPRQATLTMESPQIRHEMAQECSGTFKQRYECKQAIILQTSQRTFGDLALSLALVVLGPILAVAYYARFCRPDPPTRRPAAANLPPDDMSWKKTADSRIHRPQSGDGGDEPRDPYPPLW